MVCRNQVLYVFECDQANGLCVVSLNKRLILRNMHLTNAFSLSYNYPMTNASPTVLRMLFCALYESVLLIAVLALTTFVFIWWFGDATQSPKRYVLQFSLWGVMGLYFVWCWIKSGQTLAMQTWRIRLVDYAGQPLTMARAVKRYFFATIFFGPSYLWALFDREHLFLHDRLSGCRLVNVPKAS